MPALPADVVLLHIGPHKTGTSAVQGAFHLARPELAQHGVHYAGRRRQPYLAALAMTGRPGRPGDPAAKSRHWQDLVDEVAAARGRRVVISSERFADADDGSIHRIVDALDSSRVHVVVTVRPLAKILPSHWQQSVRNGGTTPYGAWLRRVLAKTPDASSPFWRRHAHDQLVQRWAAVVGTHNVTVIAVDDTDRLMLMHAFEQLLALPQGVLVAERDAVNRSLTSGEAEVVRRLNRAYRNRRWPDRIYARMVRLGAIQGLQRREPGPDEPPIRTPGWAAQRAGAIGAAAADAIRAAGVNVVGDLSALSAAPPTTAGDDGQPTDPLVPASAAAAALITTIEASRRVRWPQRAKHRGTTERVLRKARSERRNIAAVDGRTLTRLLARKVTRRFRG